MYVIYQMYQIFNLIFSHTSNHSKDKFTSYEEELHQEIYRDIIHAEGSPVQLC